MTVPKLGHFEIVFVFLFALALLLPASLSAQNYTFVDINYPGAEYNTPFGINDSGQIVGYYDDGSGNLHGYLYDNGVYSTIDYPGAGGTEAIGINNAGVVSGLYETNMSTNVHGFTYNIKTQVFTSFDDPNGNGITDGQGINNNNEVVGYYNGGPIYGFVYNGSFTEIQYPGAQWTLGEGINDSGQIAGTYRIDSSGASEAFFYDGSTFTSIEYPDNSQTYADGINNLGVVVGYSELNSGYTAGFLWQAGQFTPINAPQSFLEAYGINNKGQIVGFYQDADGNYTGFLGTPTSSPALQFAPVIPCRLVDTRTASGGGGPIPGGTFQTFKLPQLSESGTFCPAFSLANAAAYSLNVTAVPPGPLGYLTVWPTGQSQPKVSTLNSPDGRVKANAAIVPAGTNLAVNVFVSNTTDVVLDINGYFALPSQLTFQFYPLTPCRVADTRNPNGPLGGPFLTGGVPRDFPVLSSTCFQGVNSLEGYSFNVTAVPRGGQPLGYLTVWPPPLQQPLVSTLNDLTGTVVANAAIVPTVTGDIDAFASNDTDLVIDVNGYFAQAGTGGLSLYAVTPCRVLDTRNGNGAFMGTLVVDVVDSPCAPSSTAQAYVFNATVVPVGQLGYLTLWADGQGQPLVATLNAVDGAVTSNMAIVPTKNGSIDAYASNLTQLILDIFSYFAP